MSVLAMNAMAKAVVAPKVTASKPRASAFMGRPAALKARVAAPKARTQVTVKAASQTEDLNKKLSEVTSTVSEKWDETEEKPAVVTLGVFGLVGLVAANGVLKSIDGLPLVPDLLELVGIGFSGFYIYQNLLFKPDRAALKDSISKSLDKVL